MVAFVAAAAFAANQGNAVRIKSVVGAITISEANATAVTSGNTGLYVLVLKTTSGSDSDGVSYQLIEKDISRDNVEADFEIIQKATTRTNERIDLSVSAGQLSFTDDSARTYSTTTLGFSSVTTPVDASLLTVTPDTTNLTDTIKFALSYGGVSREVLADTTIATFKTTWQKETSLIDHQGVYTADLTLVYTIN